MRPAPSRLPLLPVPSRRSVAVGVLLVVVVAWALRTSARGERLATRFGEAASVWLLASDVDPGDVLGLGDVVLATWPAGLRPDGAVSEDPSGRVVTSSMAAGEPIVEHRLAGPDARGAAALVPDRWRAVALPPSVGLPELVVGDLVDVVAAAETGAGVQAAVVAERAIVVAVAEDGTLTVAVVASAVPRIAAALVTGVVAVALVGAGSSEVD